MLDIAFVFVLAFLFVFALTFVFVHSWSEGKYKWRPAEDEQDGEALFLCWRCCPALLYLHLNSNYICIFAVDFRLYLYFYLSSNCICVCANINATSCIFSVGTSSCFGRKSNCKQSLSLQTVHPSKLQLLNSQFGVDQSSLYNVAKLFGAKNWLLSHFCDGDWPGWPVDALPIIW